MSKNHPNDNIYSILGKLEALKPTPEEKRFALVKEIRESVEAKGSVLEGVSAVEAKLRKDFAESDFSKMSAAIQKTGKSKASADAITAAAGREKLGQKEMTRRSVAGRKDESYNPVKAVKQCAQQYMEMNGYTSVDQLEAEDIESIGGDCQMNYQDVCEILGCKLPDSLGPVKSYSPDEHGNIVDFEECTGCAMGECSVHGMAEGEMTHTGGEKVPTKFGTLHKSKATVDTEKLLSRGDVTDPDADDEPAAPAVNRGRGRPKMDTKDRSQAKMPWGGNPPKDTYKHQKGSFVHKISEGRLIDESGETLDHILNRFKHDVKRFEAGEDIYNTDLYHALFDYYSENGEMPYGTQKARDGDPVEFIHDRLDMILGDRAYGKDPANAEGYGIEDEGIEGNYPPVDNIPGKDDLLKGKGRGYYEEEVTMEDELNELARLAGIQTEGNTFSGKLAHTAKGDSFEQDGKTFTNTSSIADKELDEEETDEGNAFGQAVRNAKADGVQDGEKVEVDGKEIPVKEGMEMSEPESSDFNINTSMSSNGDKNVTVTATGEHAASLLQMLRIAGLGNGEAAQALQQPQAQPEMGDDEGAEVLVIGNQEEPEVNEDAVDFDAGPSDQVNAPHEKYGSIKAITTQGDDLNREKIQDPGTANKAANPMTNAQQTLKAVAALESKLAEEYESIKKISK